MKITILYRKMKFIFELEDNACWFNLDGKESKVNKYNLKINADRDVYATIFYDDKVVEGYIVESQDEDKNPIADNYPIEEEVVYHFIRLARPGYYL